MSLSRQHLLDGTFNKMAAEHAGDDGPLPLTEQELAASMQSALASGPSTDHVWVFGYGSLIWNQIFHHDQNERATLYGYRRKFCLKTQLSRGTPEQPGLLLGLEPGGSCGGIAYRLCGDALLEDLTLLWRREMVTGAYCPRWVSLKTKDKPITALAFVMNRNYVHYTNGLSDDETAQVLAVAKGPIGTCAEYLFNTHQGLVQHNIQDQHMKDLVALVKKIQQLQQTNEASQ